MGEPRFSLERKNFVLNLAKSITEKQDAKVPGLLLRLKSVLDEHVTMKGLAVRREILEYNLLKVLILILRQDYSVIDGQWETAAELAVILSNVICGLSVDESCRKKLEKEDLPKSIESILLLARHVYIILEASSRKQITSTEKQNTTRTLKIVIDSLLAICSTYTYLVASVLSSQWFLQLLVSDNADVAIITMTALEELVILDLDFPTKIDHNLLFTLLDELIYKLTVNTDLRIAMKASKCLLKFCDSQRHLVDSLCARYIGFYPLLKRWDGKGFDRELRQLTNILESGSCSTAQQQKQKECAVLIQATYRGYSTRKKLTRANNAFSKFHKTYR
ncbi:IQ calmodulin-binding motif-containing protein 1-like [Physella acuta]|nr:IQ calmodulin-binding motif-containing protein 1-like [Physella acuta]